MAEERLILVNESNRATGIAGKTPVHRAGILHRAFSIFIVDDKGRILLQRRSRQKYHSGGLLANSCCGHPRPGETTLAAASRRLTEELGIEARLTFGFHSRYRADLDGGMQENEYVYVYFGPLIAQPNPNPAEVSEVEFASADEIARRIARQPGEFVYWLQHYFKNHGPQIARLAKRAAREATPIAESRSRKPKAAAGRR
ncbi:MAG: isopentenyl-diphosphate Delta-isomerase [Xanthobacteraceae bacterium]|nr:isopentenyl-diphosphate Delta-isomerase [Xanthobacteraceae bacterium]